MGVSTSDGRTRLTAQQRRTYERHRRRLSMKYRVGDAPWKRAFTADISVSGIFVSSAQVPGKQEPIEVELELPRGRSVTMTGELIHGMRAPSRMQQIVKGGFALKLMQAPREWYEFCLELDGN